MCWSAPLALFFLGGIITANATSSQSCDYRASGKDLTLMYGSWEVQTDNGLKIYYINFCSGLDNPAECDGSAVCMKNVSSENHQSLGFFEKNPETGTSVSGVSFYLNYKTNSPCARDGANFSSSITFDCGKTLGSPVLLYSDACRADFLWESYLICKHTSNDPQKSVRCYDYDKKGGKRDLDGMIKRIGAYKVDDPSSTDSQRELYINVCQDIVATEKNDEIHWSNCPPGSAACWLVDGEYFSVGAPGEALKMKKDNRLSLSYVADPSSPKPGLCSGFTPNVTVTFICPGNNRGGSREPLLTSSANCQLSIEWWTEAACPEDFIVSSNCGLDVQQHGLAMDLTPLRKSEGGYHAVGHGNIEYWVNVCGPSHQSCGISDPKGNKNAVCQINGENDKKVSGMATNYSVRYVDGVVSLTYKNGGRCSHGFMRQSVILFHCNESAGIGSPKFNHEVHCTYYFDWETNHVCTAAPPTCHLRDDKGSEYDLSPLTRIAGETTHGNWEVLTGGNSGTSKRYFVNICSELITGKNIPASKHLPGSSISSVEGETVKSYGSFSNSTVKKKGGKIVLTYNEGSSCDVPGKSLSAYISLYCSPGDEESSPVLKYDDQCALELFWHTAAACPLKTVMGTNCIVSDEDSGLTFDLSRLSKTKEEDMYHVSVGDHDYYINVCRPVIGDKCDAKAGVCQVEKGSSRHWSLGEASDEILYYDGFIRLTYSNGSFYHDNIHKRSVQISFLCDPKAGAGTPTFAAEANYTYVFNWYTSYVCPVSPIQCMVTDPQTKEQYDLSSLGKPEDDADANWSIMDDSNSQKRRKFYLNVCRPVNEVWGHEPTKSHELERGCDPFAGACQTEFDGNGAEHVIISNLGVPASGPVLESQGHLVLTYADGSKCNDSQYAARIHFVCAKGQLTSSPRYLEQAGCTVSFTWETEAACPIDQQSGLELKHTCEVADPNSKFVFDLHSLTKNADDTYDVRGNSGYSYKLNICGKVTQCSQGSSETYGGCRMSGHGDEIDQKVHNSSVLQYSDDGVLTLYYISDSDASGIQQRYIISFICNRMFTKTPQLAFSRTEGENTHFDLPTHLACQPEAVDCLVTDDYGNQYDLTPLTKHRSAWTAMSSDPSKKFYLGVCRPLPPLPSCPEGTIGACMIATKKSGERKGFSLGLVQSNPTAVIELGVHSGSDVSITYDMGDKCEEDKTRRYSSRIIFFCSDEEGQIPVYYGNNTDPCEFVFMWRTPAACKIKKVTTSANQSCAVTEPLYHMTFDLSSLKAQEDYTVITETEWNFNINVCRKLQNSVGKCKESAACQINNVDMHDAGRPNSTLVYEDGVVTLTYLHGQKCHQNKFERSSTIRFTCNHGDNTTKTKPTFINEESDCTYMFNWPTPHVCPPIKIVGCTATDQTGRNYDLSYLSLADKNLRVGIIGDTSGRSYYINVCRNLLHEPGVTCPPNSAACVKMQDNKYINLGQVTSAPRYSEDGGLQIFYTDGDICKDNERYATTITFKCNTESAVLSTPVVTISEENCHAQILWTTKAACPIGTPNHEGGTCSATNPATDHTFNLSPLISPKYYEILGKDGRTFHINICGAVQDGLCTDDSAVCIVENGKGKSAGKVSKQLTYADGALAITYSSGASCEANRKYKHSSILSFVCHRSNSPAMVRPTQESKPVYIGEDAASCTHYFSWHVYEACEIQTPCSIVDSTASFPRIIDLSDLISESGHTVAITDVGDKDTVYFINICRTLEPIPGHLCPPGSAACKIHEGDPPKGIGFMTQEVTPKLDPGTKSVSLTYPTRTVCSNPGNEKSNVTSKIIITCLPGGGKGKPHLTAVTDDCVYLFEWATDVICTNSLSPIPKPTTGTSQNSCSFEDQKGIMYDFSKLEPMKLEYESSSMKISICSALTDVADACLGANVCLEKSGKPAIALGKTRTFSEGHGNYALQAVFTGGKCPDGSGDVRTNVLFMCDRFVSSHNLVNSASMIADSGNGCSYIVYWPTPYACPPLEKRCTVNDPTTGKTYDLSLLSSITHSYEFRDNDQNRYILNICQPVHTLVKRTGCKDDAAVCKFNAGSNTASTIGLLRSQSMRVVESTSGQVVEVRYSGGDMGLCGANKIASTVIQFTCSKSIHTLPTLDRFDKDSCIHYIKWSSMIACPDEIEKVEISDDGQLKDPKTGKFLDLSTLFSQSWIAMGDIRNDASGASKYNYLISFRGKVDLAKIPNRNHVCDEGTTVCQYSAEGFERKVGASSTKRYTMSDESLEITFNSEDKCGKDAYKHSHSIISLRCSHFSGLGKPHFVYESNECGYFFEWYTNAMCVNLTIPSNGEDAQGQNGNRGADTEGASDSPTQSKRGHAVAAAVLSFTILAAFCVLVLVFHKQERRVAFKSMCRRCYWSCCGAVPKSRYRYLRVGEGEEDNSLVEEDMQEQTFLLRGRNGAAATEAHVHPIGGTIVLSGEEDNEGDDIFGMPEVVVRGSKTKNVQKSTTNSAAAGTRSAKQDTVKKGEDSDDPLSFLDDYKSKAKSRGAANSRTRSANLKPARKVESYHDDDDDDLLEG